MTEVPVQTLALPQSGRVFSVISEDPRTPLHWAAMLEHELSVKLVIYSRLSPQRLGQHLNLSRIEFKWLSESMDVHALSPSLERIHHSISTRVATDGGIIWLDGVEYLVHRQGFDAFLSFTRSLADELIGSNWTVLLPYSPLSLEPTELAHLRREAVEFIISQNIPQIVDADEVDQSNEETEMVVMDIETLPVVQDTQLDITKQSELKLLSTIPEASFTPAVLSRRIQQWQDMGLDVSELEFALKAEIEKGYTIYLDVEQRVRRAVECEKRIQMIEIRGHLVEAAKMRFRIFQLTGLDSVESRLDELLSGSM
jgi:hypothetical protein